MKGFYVVVITKGDNDIFFSHEEAGLINPKTCEIIREPMGFFVLNIDKACKFKSRRVAEIYASGYQNAKIWRVSK